MNPLPAVFGALLALLQLCVGVRPYNVPKETDIFTVATGTWDWAGRPGTCVENPHTISFSPDRKHMYLTFKDSVEGQRVFDYEVRETTRHSIRAFIVDESRRTDAGALVVWDLVLVSRDAYRWHRTDWSTGGYTDKVIRCPPPVSKR